jgi:hypothetical protein
MTARRVGWSVVPIFDAQGEGYVRRSASLAPLFQDGPPPGVWRKIVEDDSVDHAIARLVQAAADADADPSTNVGADAPPRLFPSRAALFVRTRDPQLSGLLNVRASRYTTHLIPDALRASFSEVAVDPAGAAPRTLVDAALAPAALSPELADQRVRDLLASLADKS